MIQGEVRRAAERQVRPRSLDTADEALGPIGERQEGRPAVDSNREWGQLALFHFSGRSGESRRPIAHGRSKRDACPTVYVFFGVFRLARIRSEFHLEIAP